MATDKYQSRTNTTRQWVVQGFVDSSQGSDHAVAVNNETASENGDHFHKVVTASSTARVKDSYQLRVADITSSTTDQLYTEPDDVEKLFPPQAESYTYDEAGNLEADGLWKFFYDAENRLVKVEPNKTLAAGDLRFLYTYDFMGRRVRIQTEEYNSGWSQTDDQWFVYDGWNPIAELNASGSIVRSFTWGLDINGGLQTAGGVGGLLTIKDGSEVYFALYDGNGNVVGLVDDTGSVDAVYEYDPFGQLIRSTGNYAAENRFRFSTKWQDATELYYYGLRFYNADTGRFLNRDPIGEQGGLNLYAFVGNDPVNQWDYLGLTIYNGGTLETWEVQDDGLDYETNIVPEDFIWGVMGFSFHFQSPENLPILDTREVVAYVSNEDADKTEKEEIEIDCEGWKNQRDLAQNIANRTFDRILRNSPSSAQDILSTIENANAILAVTGSMLGAIEKSKRALDGVSGYSPKYGPVQIFNNFSPTTIRNLEIGLKGLGVFGAAIDTYQTIDSLRKGDSLGGISNASSGILNIGVLAIAKSHPAIAISTSVGAVGIGLYESIGMEQIRIRDNKWVSEGIEKDHQLFESANNKYQHFQSLISENCP